MNIYEKLGKVQKELKAPKGQYNSFGKYKYRSCEDIMEAAKPLCVDNGLVLTIRDEIVMVGNRVYVKAVATLHDTESNEFIESTAFAREEETKKGMDSSQVTGATSSYARKYCLNGLFCIDDTKDADTDENRNESDGRYNQQQAKASKPASAQKTEYVVIENGQCKVLTREGLKDISSLGRDTLQAMSKVPSYAKAVPYINKLLNEGMGAVDVDF